MSHPCPAATATVRKIGAVRGPAADWDSLVDVDVEKLPPHVWAFLEKKMGAEARGRGEVRGFLTGAGVHMVRRASVFIIVRRGFWCSAQDC